VQLLLYVVGKYFQIGGNPQVMLLCMRVEEVSDVVLAIYPSFETFLYVLHFLLSEAASKSAFLLKLHRNKFCHRHDNQHTLFLCMKTKT